MPENKWESLFRPEIKLEMFEYLQFYIPMGNLIWKASEGGMCKEEYCMCLQATKQAPSCLMMIQSMSLLKIV